MTGLKRCFYCEIEAVVRGRCLFCGKAADYGALADKLAEALVIAERIIRSEWQDRPIPDGEVFATALAKYREQRPNHSIASNGSIGKAEGK